MEKGALIGHPVQGVRVVLEDGQTHTVDSSDMAFRFAASMAVRESVLKAGAQVLEPVMSVEVRGVICSEIPFHLATYFEVFVFTPAGMAWPFARPHPFALARQAVPADRPCKN